MFPVELRRSGSVSLPRQIYDFIRDDVLSGRLSPHEVLPSERDLARQLGVSRNTVNEAYEMLRTEGFVNSRPGSRTRVSGGLAMLPPDSSGGLPALPPASADTGESVDFTTGSPDLTRFPHGLWNRIAAKTLTELPDEFKDYTGPEGYPPLRRETAAWLFRSRGIIVDAEDVFITAGSLQAFNILVDLLRRRGGGFALESPCHPGFYEAAERRGVPVCRMPVDESGARFDALPDAVCAYCVTPSHQFPLGVVLSAKRRVALIKRARTEGAFILEDDYDSEYRFRGMPVSPLHSLDSSRVIYMGTFSKSLYPALRVGFVVLPKPLRESWRAVRGGLDVQNPLWEQAALAEFLRSRKMDRHVNRMRRLYGEKRKVLLDLVDSLFGERAIVWGDLSGLHVTLQVLGMRFDDAFRDHALQRGLRIHPLESYCPSGAHGDKLLIGYGHLDDESLRKGMKILRNLVVDG